MNYVVKDNTLKIELDPSAVVGYVRGLRDTLKKFFVYPTRKGPLHAIVEIKFRFKSDPHEVIAVAEVIRKVGSVRMGGK